MGKVQGSVAGLIVLAALSASCNALEHDVAFKDTEGRVFRGRCKARCVAQDAFTTDAGDPKPVSPPSSPDEAPGWVLSGANHRYLTICPAWKSKKESSSGAFWTGSDCRLVTCSKDAPCPAADFMESPQCIDGYCGDPSRELDVSDVQAVCLAGTGPESPRTPEQTKRLDLATMACANGSCSIPAGCKP